MSVRGSGRSSPGGKRRSSGTWLPTISGRLGYWVDAVAWERGPAGGSWAVRQPSGEWLRLGSGRDLADAYDGLVPCLAAEWRRQQAQQEGGSDGAA